MNKKLVFRTMVLVLVLAGIYFVAFARKGEEGGRRGNGGGGGFGGPGMGGPATVATSPVSRGSFVASAEFVGTLQAEATAELYAKLNGQIVEMRVDTGDPVGSGQVLARIDPGELGERVEQAQAAVRMAEATLGERRAALGIARTTADRTESLYQQQLVAQQQHDAAQAELQGAAAQVQVAQAAVAQARANLGVTRADEKALIIAPFSGVIGKRHLDRGAFAATNRPVFTLVDLSTIKTTIPLTEKDAARVRPGQTATVTADAFPGTGFQGVVARIASVFDPETNTTEAEVEIANADGRLKPGMFANVSIAFATEPGALLVPRAAVLEDEREAFLFVARQAPAREEGAPPTWTAKKVPVKRIGTGTDKAQDQIAVEGALQPGQQVITIGQQDLRDGAPVILARAGAGARQAGPGAAVGAIPGVQESSTRRAL